VSGLNGNGRIHNGEIGGVVFHTMTIGLAPEMRRLVLPAVCLVREYAEHKGAEERRAVIVAFQNEDDLTAAGLAANHALEHYHAERAVVLSLKEMGFDQSPDQFVDWWTEAIGMGHYESRSDFIALAEQRTKWTRRQPAAESSPFVEPEVRPDNVNEGDDDPHRLARLHLARYQRESGPMLRYYRGEGFGWSDGAFRTIVEPELQAGLAGTIKNEFDRLNQIAIESWGAVHAEAKSQS
jgi:Arc/MetJ-type ribon-helix-helix transcriptional regulator